MGKEEGDDQEEIEGGLTSSNSMTLSYKPIDNCCSNEAIRARDKDFRHLAFVQYRRLRSVRRYCLMDFSLKRIRCDRVPEDRRV